ncbi:MAG: hypothetical protein FWH04_06365 [Oscillospiraceae bacterium]|nr:hypothetical protein [Oscillospiraceae bacterium]
MQVKKTARRLAALAAALAIAVTAVSPGIAMSKNDEDNIKIGDSVKKKEIEQEIEKAAAPTNFRITGYQREGNGNVGFYFAFNGTIPQSGELRMQISEARDFANPHPTNYTAGNELYRSYSSYIPGSVYYARLQIYDPNKPSENNARYSEYSNVISFTVPAMEMSALSATVKQREIRLYFGAENATGFQIWRVGGLQKNYQRLASTTEDTFLDTGLRANTKYTYRIRPYYFNTRTKKIIYGGYTLKEYVTNGSSLNLKYDISDGKYVTLSWEKVNGAKEYKIYRTNASSVYDTVKNGEYNGYTNYELISTVKNANTLQFTDKAVRLNTSYTYKLEAITSYVKNQGNVSESVTANTAFRNIIFMNSFQMSNGTQFVKWHRVAGVQGYIIEKLNAVGEWVQFRKLGSNSSSVTLPAAKLGQTDSYRIAAYTDNSRSSPTTVPVISRLGVVQSVSASPSSQGIRVTWSSVPGAHYYKVYRTISNTIYDYNADAGYYINTVGTGSSVYQYANVTKQGNGYYDVPWQDRTDRFTTTSVNDNYYPTGQDDYVGPRPGQTYYYYVMAYAQDNEGNQLARSLGSRQIAVAVYSSVTRPGTPGLRTAKGKTAGQAVVSIPSAAGNAAGYKLYRSQSQNSGWEFLASIEQRSFTDTGLEPGKSYYYRARSYRAGELGGDVDSAYSATVKYTEPKQKLANPSKLKVKGRKVTWKNVKNNSGYTLKVTRGKKTVYKRKPKKNAKSLTIPKKALKKGSKHTVTLTATGKGGYKSSKASKKKFKA